MWSIVRLPFWRSHRFLLTVFKNTRWDISFTSRSHTILRHSGTKSLTSSLPPHSRRRKNSQVSAVKKLSQRPNIKKKEVPTNTTAKNSSTPAERLTCLVGASLLEDEETQLTEADVRLAMRTLMEQHLSQKSILNRIADQNMKRRLKLEEIANASRLRRIEEKTNNSLKLLSADRATLGDGILPLFSQHRSNTSVLAKDTNSSYNMTDWRAYNPVSGCSPDEISTTEEEKVSNEWEYKTLESLCEPNLSVYDSESDIRIRSEDALREEQAIAQSEAAGVVFEDDDMDVKDGVTRSVSPKSITSGNKALKSRPITPISTSMLHYDITGEEDADFPVHIYEEDND
ncbi:unnamed protein product [Phytomonas sp. Hart1]|nr:unnamed protein product [Phytomonas sp. Hart1]|eukprot:CCW66344.1 unnamed protein product [Phytomonas sp. isolate Hart1]